MTVGGYVVSYFLTQLVGGDQRAMLRNEREKKHNSKGQCFQTRKYLHKSGVFLYLIFFSKQCEVDIKNCDKTCSNVHD